MTQLKKTASNGESVQAVSKQNVQATGNRFSKAYWEKRVFRPWYTRDGERFDLEQFSVKIAHGGRRHTVPLATNTLDDAAGRAVKLYKALKLSGWDAALNLFRPDAKKIDHELTIGRYLELVESYAPLENRTAANYSYALRKIGGSVGSVRLKKGENRFDPSGKWRQASDEIPLAKITPVTVEDWRTAFIKEHRGDHLAEQRAVRSANSYIRNARALFSRRIMDAMKKHDVKLPNPLPFAGIRLTGKTGSTRYRSQIDAGKLLQAARMEFAQNDPDAYAVALLALGVGLRRSEIDALQWQNIMPDKKIIRVMTTAQRRVKSDESEGDIHADPGLFAELEKTRRAGSTLFVIEPNTEHRKTKDVCYYRANETFKKVIAWLRSQGVMTSKPLHTLRKEFGSVVASSGDILQAQRQLRHAQISTTEQFYADGRTRATMAVGALLKEAI